MQYPKESKDLYDKISLLQYDQKYDAELIFKNDTHDLILYTNESDSFTKALEVLISTNYYLSYIKRDISITTKLIKLQKIFDLELFKSLDISEKDKDEYNKYLETKLPHSINKFINRISKYDSQYISNIIVDYMKTPIGKFQLVSTHDDANKIISVLYEIPVYKLPFTGFTKLPFPISPIPYTNLFIRFINDTQYEFTLSLQSILLTPETSRKFIRGKYYLADLNIKVYNGMMHTDIKY